MIDQTGIGTAEYKRTMMGQRPTNNSEDPEFGTADECGL
jgi:hypothetical protein